MSMEKHAVIIRIFNTIILVAKVAKNDGLRDGHKWVWKFRVRSVGRQKQIEFPTRFMKTSTDGRNYQRNLI